MLFQLMLTKFFKSECFRVHRKLITWSINAKGLFRQKVPIKLSFNPLGLFFIQNIFFIEFGNKLHLSLLPFGSSTICLQEGVNGVNRLATKGEKYNWLPTKRVKNYRLLTGKILTDYRHGLNLVPRAFPLKNGWETLSIFVFRKKSILHFFSSR